MLLLWAHWRRILLQNSSSLRIIFTFCCSFDFIFTVTHMFRLELALGNYVNTQNYWKNYTNYTYYHLESRLHTDIESTIGDKHSLDGWIIVIPQPNFNWLHFFCKIDPTCSIGFSVVTRIKLIVCTAFSLAIFLPLPKIVTVTTMDPQNFPFICAIFQFTNFLNYQTDFVNDAVYNTSIATLKSASKVMIALLILFDISIGLLVDGNFEIFHSNFISFP